jgi:bifunctional non-homologous end joining protein LigD
MPNLVDLRKSGGVATRRKPSEQPEALRPYRAKRDPAKTPEPMGAGRVRRGGALRFVIQEHHARALHWDLRLERDGVLASWALPKGLPDDPKRNHLAVHTEDHPLEYATFSGEIPAGEYGGGTMSIWDRGTYESEKWTDREVKFVLHGTRASGDFVLFQTDGKNWMIHRHGEAVLTDPVPTSIKPMLAVLGPLPEGPGRWAYEVKWDGARTLAFVDGGRVRLQSRSGRDVTTMFPELAHMGEHLGMHAVVLDGEVVAFGEDGRPSFARLQNRLHLSDPKEARRRAAGDPVQFVAFDVLYADGRSLLADPYDARRARLEEFGFSGSNFTTTECFRDVSGRDVLRAVTENGLEGVVAKRRDSTYRPGRRVAEWVKVKVVTTQEVVVGGWTEGKGGRGASLGSLLLGIPGADGLDYVGKVGTGFDDRALQSIVEQLRSLRARGNPFGSTITATEAKGAHFVRPSLVGEVAYGEWTPAGRLRHPTWRGLRPDKTPADVSRESETSAGEPDDTDLARLVSRPSASTAKSGSQRVQVGERELSVTNLDKVLFPETGFTKGQLIDYYARIAPAMLPHLAGRPLTMKRFPDGVEGKFFFEKHVPSHSPRWVKTLTIPSERQGEITYATVPDLPTLIWAANLGTIEFHVPLWRASGRKKLPTNPDQMVFDLDPGEGTSIVECCAVAELIVDALAETHPVVLAKTSGQKGLQLYCPLSGGSNWDAVRDEAHDLARRLESEHRDLVVSVMRKELRRGRVLIDWSQNHSAKTTVAVYSVRATPRPMVSTPVTLDEVGRCARTGDPTLLQFDTEQVLARVAEDGDLFAPLGHEAAAQTAPKTSKTTTKKTKAKAKTTAKSTR